MCLTGELKAAQLLLALGTNSTMWLIGVAPLTLAFGAFSAHIFTRGECICLLCAQAP